MDELVVKERDKYLLILFALFAGILFDYFFYRKTLGISYPVYTVLLLCLFWWSKRKAIEVRKSFGWFLIIPILLLSVTFAVYSNPVLEALNFMLIPLLLIVHTLLAVNNNTSWSDLRMIGDIVKRAVPLTIENFPQPFLLIAEKFKPKERDNVRVTGKKIIIGLLISVPILLMVVLLLSSADLVFRHYLSNLIRSEKLIHFKTIVSHSLIILLVFAYVFGYIWSFHVKPPKTENQKVLKEFIWDPTIVLTVLFIINGVYLLFSIVQFSYLYGGEQLALPVGFTYAEYARRGFFELVLVTIINLSILLSSKKFVKKDNRTLYLLVLGLFSLLDIFSLNMLFSAHFKMSLYELAYGLTYLRVFVHYFMGLLLVFFLLALTSIWFRKPPLVKAYIIVTLVFYTALNFINVDKIIASNNINMYLKTGRVDIYYLGNLSDDAIPEIVRLAETNRGFAHQVHDYLLKRKQDLSKDRPWQSLNYSRYKAKSALIKYFR